MSTMVIIDRGKSGRSVLTVNGKTVICVNAQPPSQAELDRLARALRASTRETGNGAKQGG